MTDRYRYFYLAIFYICLFGCWQLLFSLKIVPDYVFPSPMQVINRLIELTADGFLGPSIRATLWRMITGFAIAAACGVLIGLAMGTSEIVKNCLKSLFLGLSTLPTAAWAPIGLLIFGLSDRAIYFVILMSAAPAVAIATAEAISRIPPLFVRAAQTLGTPKYMMPTRVILPAAFPNILTGIKLGWTLGWHGAVAAELIKSSVGLGYLLHMGRELNDAPQVLGVMMLTILIGVLLDRFLFSVLERGVHYRWGMAGV